MDIITARFHDRAAAAAAVSALRERGFATGQESTAAGAGHEFEVSATPAHSPGVERTGTTAGGGAVAGGVAGGILGVAAAATAVPLLGPGAIIAGIGVGAYAGSLLGALHGAES